MGFDEDALIARSRLGDLDAFNALVEHYQRSLYNFCLRLLGAPQPAEDAAQDAFIAAFRRLDTFRGGSFRAWLFRIAANACYDEMRRRRARPSVSLDIPSGYDDRPHDRPDTGPTLDDHVQRQELARCLHEALASLPPDQRLAAVLCDVQGLPYEEIAQVMGVSLGTVKSRISRARARLRKALMAHRELLPASIRPTSEEP